MARIASEFYMQIATFKRFILFLKLTEMFILFGDLANKFLFYNKWSI